MFSVNVLLYGDHLPLAQRCLNSIAASADWSLIEEIRIGFNDATIHTQAFVRQWAEPLPVPVLLYMPFGNVNVGKYPLMRRMLHDPNYPVAARDVMWFDDDSYLRTPDPRWWANVAARADMAAMVGKKYRISANSALALALTFQPWFRHKPLGPGRRIIFCQGGWWVIRHKLLEKWDYPFKELYHNGGDVILGELAHQQEWAIHDFNDGIAINADDNGVESAAKRRGILTSTPLWRDHNPAKAPDLSHHQFQHIVTPGNRFAPRYSLDRPGA